MKLAHYVRSKGYTVYIDGDNTVINQTVAYIRNLSLPSNALLLDIHYNSFTDPKATGCEVVIPDKYSAFEFDAAYKLLSGMAKATGLPKRRVIREGQSKRKKLAWMSIPGENILIEPGFISNPNDYDAIIKNEDKLVQVVGDIIIELISK